MLTDSQHLVIVASKLQAFWQQLDNRRDIRNHPLSPHRKPTPATKVRKIRYFVETRCLINPADVLSDTREAKGRTLGFLIAGKREKVKVCSTFFAHLPIKDRDM